MPAQTYITPKTRGYDLNYFGKIIVSHTGTGWTNAHADGRSDVAFPFVNQGFLLLNETASSIVEVSYNGNTLHDELNANLVSVAVCYDFRTIDGIWFRMLAGGPATVSVRAWCRP